jgi:hypothetical protein
VDGSSHNLFLRCSHPSRFANSSFTVEFPAMHYHEYSLKSFSWCIFMGFTPSQHIMHVHYIMVFINPHSTVVPAKSHEAKHLFPYLSFLHPILQASIPPKRKISDISNVSGSVKAVKKGKSNT